jgi:hypothetical protein
MTRKQELLEQKQKHAEIQRRLEETFPVIASGSYVRPFEVSSICWPLNWTYLGHKDKEKITWEYRFNSRGMPLFLYREAYSWTTIQATFTIHRNNERCKDLSGMYVDQAQLEHNQAHVDPPNDPEFIEDYLIIQPRVEEGDMLRKLCKFDRKLQGAFIELNDLEKTSQGIPKTPLERMFYPVREYLAMPFIAQRVCSGAEFPSQSEVTEYARSIWDKILF